MGCWAKVSNRWVNASTGGRLLAVFIAGLSCVAIILALACFWKDDNGIGWVAKHSLSTLAAVLGVVAGFVQARKAGNRAQHHRTAGGEGNAPRPAELDIEVVAPQELLDYLKGEHRLDANHFEAVALAWWVVFGGAAFAAVGEFVDWWLP